MKLPLLLCTLAALVLAPLISNADGLAPAVSGPNGKLSFEGGAYDDDAAGLALGSITTPLGYSFGLQTDGAIGEIDDRMMGGGGVHLFTRDPSRYLLGFYGSYHTWDSINIWRAAGEYELYINRISISGLAGYESVGVPTTSGGLQVVTPDDNHFFGNVDLAYYIIDDLKIYGGYHYVNETSLGAAGIEYLFRGTAVPTSFFAKADFGDNDYNRITGGVKFYLGQDPSKSLIERQRTEDPEVYTPMFPTLVTQAQTKKTVKKEKKKPEPEPTTPQCIVASGVPFTVTSPATGDCICPSGTSLAGQHPAPFSGSFVCAA